MIHSKLNANIGIISESKMYLQFQKTFLQIQHFKHFIETDDIRGSIFNMLRTVFPEFVAHKYNWAGTHGKLPIKHLNLVNVIKCK